MNRLEVLLEALKECNRREEVLYSRYLATGGECGHMKAADLSGNITDAIAATLDANDVRVHKGSLIRELNELLDTNTRLGQKLHAVIADRDALSAKVENLEKELCGVYDKHIAATKPNPALENVLAKLRILPPLYIESHDNCPVCDTLTLGDLRRWVESEGKV